MSFSLSLTDAHTESSTTVDDVALARVRLGQCSTCGKQTYKKVSNGLFSEWAPLTVVDEVNMGKCLSCHPDIPPTARQTEASVTNSDVSPASMPASLPAPSNPASRRSAESLPETTNNVRSHITATESAKAVGVIGTRQGHVTSNIHASGNSRVVGVMDTLPDGFFN